MFSRLEAENGSPFLHIRVSTAIMVLTKLIDTYMKVRPQRSMIFFLLEQALFEFGSIVNIQKQS